MVMKQPSVKKKRTQTAEQKKKVEDYKSKQKAMGKNKTIQRGDTLKSNMPGSVSTKNFVTEFKDKKQSINRLSLKTGGRSAAKQEAAAVARNYEKRGPAIRQTAEAYQKSRTKKKAK